MILVMFAWLELAEYLSILLVIIGLVVYVISGDNTLLFSAIPLALILNALNRLRLENRTKTRIAAALNIQLKRFSGEIAEIRQKLQTQLNNVSTLSKPKSLILNTPKSDNQIIANLQEDLDSLNKSITSIINYLSENKLDQRVQTLEQICQTPELRQIITTANQGDVNLPARRILDQPPPEYDIDVPPKIAWKCIHILNAHQESVTDLAITGDNKYLLSVSWDQYLKLWSLDDGNELDAIQGSDQGLLTVSIRAHNYLNHGIATGSLDQDIKIWSLPEGKNESLGFKLEYTLTQHTGSIHGLEIAPNRKILVSGSYDQTVKQWDLQTGRLLSSCYDDTGSINAIAVHEQGGLIVSGGGDGMITLWELGSDKKLGLLVGNLTSLESLAISKSGEMVAAGCADGSIKIWELPATMFNLFQEIEPSIELLAHQGQVMDLTFHPDGTLLYTAGVDGLIKIWHPSTGKELGHLKIGDDNRIFSLCLSLDGQILAAGGVDGTIKVWQQNQLM
jgi:WD40 repeat protein